MVIVRGKETQTSRYPVREIPQQRVGMEMAWKKNKLVKYNNRNILDI